MGRGQRKFKRIVERWNMTRIIIIQQRILAMKEICLYDVFGIYGEWLNL